MPLARSLTKFVNFNENLEKLWSVCKTLAKNLGEACNRRFCTKGSTTFLIGVEPQNFCLRRAEAFRINDTSDPVSGQILI